MDVSTALKSWSDLMTSPAAEVTPAPRTPENHTWIYTAPLLLILGVVGNALVVAVMTGQRMRGTSTSVYLSVVALADMAVVVIGLVPEWLGQMGIVKLWNVHPWVCRIELYLYYTALDFAIWMLVAFTCDRVIAVRFPLQKYRLCRPRNAVIASCCIFAVASLNAHVFWTRGAQYEDDGTLVGNCRYLAEYYTFEAKVRPWIILAVAMVGPFVIIAVCNVILLCTVRTARNQRKISVCAQQTSKGMQRRYGQTTVMCLITCFAFMVLVLPNIVLLIGKSSWSHDNPAYWLARAVAGQLVFLNHSINFLLYSLTGTRFRTELVELFKGPADRRTSTTISTPTGSGPRGPRWQPIKSPSS